MVLLIGIIGALEATNATNFFAGEKTAKNTNTDTGIVYGPPTEAEKKEAEKIKDKPTQTPPAPTSEATGKRNVTPTLTSWGQNPSTKDLEAAGYVSGIVENGGTCTLTATRGSKQVSESISATQNAQNVSCGLITIARSNLSTGTWSLILSYSSASSEGTSNPQNQEVK